MAAMNYEQVVDAFRERFKDTDVSSVPGTLAFQINMTGNPHGIFYIEIKNGEVHIEPYEYYDRNAILTASASNLLKLINGKLDRSNAYEYAGAAVEKILEENPTVEVLIDLHRDGVAEGTRLVTEINGKPTAKIMFFNGLSRSRTNGNIDYLPNPYIQDNLAFSLQMQINAEENYPGFVRHIYLRAYRYNLHLMPKSLLVEAGAQTNTVEEMMNAMEVLADMLEDVLTGE